MEEGKDRGRKGSRRKGWIKRGGRDASSICTY